MQGHKGVTESVYKGNNFQMAKFAEQKWFRIKNPIIKQ